jgi:hypothetical protein
LKQYADATMLYRSFQEGEQVYVKIHLYAQQIVVARPCPTLSSKYFGPYKVPKRLVLLLLMNWNCMLLVKYIQLFHVSQLKQHVPDHTPVFTELQSKQS